MFLEYRDEIFIIQSIANGVVEFNLNGDTSS